MSEKILQKCFDDSAKESDFEAAGSYIEQYYLLPKFYRLPFQNLYKIVENSNSSVQVYKTILRKCSIAYPNEAPLLLKAIPSIDCSLKEQISILSSLTVSPFCMDLQENYENEQSSVSADIPYMLDNIKQEIASLNEKVSHLSRPNSNDPTSAVLQQMNQSISSLSQQMNQSISSLSQQMHQAQTQRNLPRCTYLDHGRDYIDGPFYKCYTCKDLPPNQAICPQCAAVCHRGHRLIKCDGRYYCDCGGHFINCHCKLVP